MDSMQFNQNPTWYVFVEIDKLIKKSYLYENAKDQEYLR